MTLPEKRAELEKSISEALDKFGIWQGGTCATGAGYGWDVLAHHALCQIKRNPPTGWYVSCTTKFECTDWTITHL